MSHTESGVQILINYRNKVSSRRIAEYNIGIIGEKTLIFIFTNVSATDSFSLHCINIVDYHRSAFDSLSSNVIMTPVYYV